MQTPHDRTARMQDWGLRAEGAGQRHRRLITHLDRVLAAHPDRSVPLGELCGTLGVAERTLRAICVQELGMSPRGYMRLCRLRLVRQALLAAEPACETVTAIAMRHGFYELGRFSAIYRTAFGESPSATLRRDAVGRAVQGAGTTRYETPPAP
jgi:transcriptional regulator GlxA family with amidase domain